MSVNVNLLIKEAIANMPDTLNTKKEIDEYYKVAMKEINEKLKEEKKANKAAPKKRVAKAKPVEVDDDGNEIVKVKKPLNNYQKFIKEQRPKVKEDYPELSGEEIFKKIAELWKQHKEDIKNGDGEPKKDSDDEPKSDSDAETDAKAAEAAEAYINSEEEDEAYEAAEADEAAEVAEADVKTTVVVEEKKEKPKEKKEKKPKKETS